MSLKTRVDRFKSDIDSLCVHAGKQLKTNSNNSRVLAGLLHTRDSNNLQYVTSATGMLLVYSKTLNAAQINEVTMWLCEILLLSNQSFCKIPGGRLGKNR
ncbi:hypothetical protein NE237_027031 [Protea cynaroides]|uniref:Uncharacterized protein n=1 Tax=Protea cynaroides TaxID=273540 RepID=A0A9Q0GR26_9MAGN|nr:hypothetical protein NE237_027031 [Protea cynaroides]